VLGSVFDSNLKWLGNKESKEWFMKALEGEKRCRWCISVTTQNYYHNYAFPEHTLVTGSDGKKRPG